jgi:serine protease
VARGRVVTDTRLAGRVWFFTGAKYRPISFLTVISFRTAGRLAALTVLAIVLLAPAAEASTAHAPGELVVRYRAGTTGVERDQIRAAAGVESAGTIDGQTQRVRLSGAGTLDEAAASLRADGRVVHALPNYVAKATAFVPNDPGRGTGWAALQWNFVGPFGINLAAAWENAIAAGAPGGQDVVVAVLDTGVAYRTSSDRRYVRAPDLERTRFVQGRDFIRGNKLPYDRNGHGTFVTGVISQATNNGIGVAGVAYRSKVMPVRVLDHEGKGDVATIARGIRFASRRGARIINMLPVASCCGRCEDMAREIIDLQRSRQPTTQAA